MAPPAPAADPCPVQVDARAVRFSQGIVALLVLAAAATGEAALLALPALHLLAAATLGPRGNLPGSFFCAVIRPRLAGDAPEDARPPRFAASIGATVLGLSLVAHLAGLPAVGWALAALVATLATLSATTGLCVGCKLYWLIALYRRARAGLRA